MKTSLIAKFDVKSMFCGVVLAMAAVGLLGAEKAATSKAPESRLSFLVLESSPIGDHAKGYQSLKMCPHYGKIDGDSLKFRLANETQEIKLILRTGEGSELRRGDIIGFESSYCLKLGPGESVTRHLPSGGQERVP